MQAEWVATEIDRGSRSAAVGADPKLLVGTTDS
jgi:hypothetical protein